MPNQDPYIAQELLSHQTFLRRLAIDLVGKDADDLVQDVWQRALERPPLDGRQLRGWLARVARNLAANSWRDEARRRSREVRRASEQPAADELVARFELRKELVGALDSLNQSGRETILLRYFEGLAPRDIARRQGVPVATVKKRLQRGLEQLREALDKRHGGDRATWMSAVTALATPVGSGVVTGALVIGGIAMGTMMKVSAAVLVASACVYFVTRTPRTVAPPSVAVAPPTADVELVGSALVPAGEGLATEAVQRSVVVAEPPARVSALAGTNVLRVILEGITEEDARVTTVTLTGVDERAKWPEEIRDSWPCDGVTSDFDLDPFLARVAERDGDLRALELEVEVNHPHHLSESTRVPLSRGVELANGKTVHEVRVWLVRPEFWPEFKLAVRDAHTRAHLDDIELLSGPGMSNFTWGRNPIRSLLADGLSSPVALMGGRDADEPEVEVPYLALRPAAGEPPRLVKLEHYMSPGHGVILYARAPGYAWGSIALDLSKSEQRELLLRPGSAIDVRLTNVQLERYRALETKPMLCVYWIRKDGGNQGVHFEPLNETLETEGLRFDGLKPGGYRVTVELGGGSWTERPVLALEEVSLAVGAPRELVLALADPPAPPEQATLGGVLSFPDFSGEEDVRLRLYHANWRGGDADAELSLADMERVGGTLPSWSFHLEDLPVGLYQVQLLPFQKNWMIELPAGGAEDLELVVPELAEVLVETVDTRTGERIPLEVIRYGYPEDLPGRVHHEWSGTPVTVGFEDEPGRFRFWTAPGAAYVRTYAIPSGLNYGIRREDLELVPGLQSVRFELFPACAIHFEFRVDGAAPRLSDEIWEWVHYGTLKCVRAVDHKGHSRGRVGEQLTAVSAPGVYEISFEALTKGRFHPIPPRLVDVRAGETAEVIVELHRK